MAEALTYDKIPALLPRWLWWPWYPLGELTLNVAQGGTGKTTEMADVTARVTTGAAWPDGTPGGPPASVIWITLEDDPSMLAFKFIAAGADRSRITDLSTVNGEPFYLDGTKTDCLHVLEEKIREIGDVRLVVIDTLRKVSRRRLTDPVGADMILLPLIAAARRTGAAIVANHHTTKAGSVAGSETVVSTSRHVLMLTDEDGAGIVEMGIHKTNITDKRHEPAYYEVEGEREKARAVWLDEDAQAHTEEKAETLVLAALKAARGPLTEQQLTAATGVPYGQVRLILDALMESGTVVSTGEVWSERDDNAERAQGPVIPFETVPDDGTTPGNT